MNDITGKLHSLRKATAQAIVQVSSPQTIVAIREGTVPKGNVFEFSRAAGLLGIKRTSDMIPDCHPLPVEFAAIAHSIEGLNILVTVEVHTIYKTGVEVEAMHGASVTAITIYDMLKPIDKGVEISGIRLISKSGGKSDLRNPDETLKCAVVVCSDSVSKGLAEDKSGKAVVEKLKKWNLQAAHYSVVPDEQPAITEIALRLKAEGYRLAIFTGGTGVSSRDVTPDALRPLVTMNIPGIMEFARSYGQSRTPFAMLSRGIAGFSDQLLLVTVPGSVKGAVETIDALFPQILHVFSIAKGEKHS